MIYSLFPFHLFHFISFPFPYFRPICSFSLFHLLCFVILGNVSFYKRSASWIGQSPLTSLYEGLTAYSTFNTTLEGSCGFSVSYHEGVYPFNNTAKLIMPASTGSGTGTDTPETAVDTMSPSVSPSTAPVQRPPVTTTRYPTRMTRTPSSAVIAATTLTPTRSVNTNLNFSCLSTCPNYPGLEQFHPVMSTGCDFFLSEIFLVCSTFAIAHGLCPVPECAMTCTVEDYCTFGSNSITYCDGTSLVLTHPQIF